MTVMLCQKISIFIYIGSSVIWCIFWQIGNDLQKMRCRPWKIVPSNVPGPLAYTLIHLSLFWSMVVYLPKGNLIFLCIFFSPSIVAVSVPFTEVQNRKRLREVYKIPNKSRFCGRLPFCMHMSLLLGKCINACPMFPPNQVQ